MRRWLKWCGIALGVLAIVVAVLLAWLLGTSSGLRFVLDRAATLTDGALTVQQAGGRLAGPLDLHGVRYHDANAGVDARISDVRLDLRVPALLLKRLHVLAFDVQGVDVALTTPKNPPTPQPSQPISLQAPLDVLIDRASVTGIRVAQDGEAVFAADRLDLGGAWTRAGIALKQLALAAPAGHAEASGVLTTSPDYQGNGQASFAWKQGDATYAGTLQSRSDGRRAKLQVALTQPVAAHLDLDLAQRGDYAWTARLAVPRFDPHALTGSDALKSLAVDLDGNGDRHGGTFTGTLGLNDYHVALQPLQAALSDDFGTLAIRQLVLTSPEIKGRAEASGVVHLDAQPVGAELKLAWDGIDLPPELAGQSLASDGRLDATGNADSYRAQGNITLGPPGQPSRLALDIDGGTREITINTLELEQPQGGMQARGTLTLQPALAWRIDVDGQGFDPGQFAAGWNGALDFRLASEGQLVDAGTRATVQIDKLAGSLRQRKVRGSGTLELGVDKVLAGQLDLASGDSRISIVGKPGARNDITTKLHVTSLGDWLDVAGGRLDGTITLRGQWPKLALTAQAGGESLALGERHVARLTLDANLPDITTPGGRARLQLDDVHGDGLAFSSIDLDASGTEARHQARLQAHGRRLSGEIAIDGRFANGDWHGTLQRLDLEPGRLPAWHLVAPVAASWIKGNFTLDELCLSAGDPSLCASARASDDGRLDASWRLHAFPVALLGSLGSLPMRTDGHIDGEGRLQRQPGADLVGQARLRSDQGSLTWLENPDGPLLRWQALTLDADLDAGGTRVEAHAGIGDSGQLDARATLGADSQTLSGQLDLHLDDLGFAELFSSEVANVKGKLDARFALGGTLSQPALSGQATLDDFAAEVPGAGLKLDAGHVVARTTSARSLELQGTVKSGDGTLEVGGTVGLDDDAPTRITVRGKSFLAASIPAARVVVSPDLTIARDAGRLDLGGSVGIDRADIDLGKLPGAGAMQASPDVVVVDRPAKETSAATTIAANVRIDLGEHTRIKGMGLDGRISGVLAVQQRPGRDPVGQGQIVVDGNYRAYGQDLKIQRGRLLFASTPLDNPGLDIRATRSLRPNATIDEGQQVGLNISGTARRPVMTVFSNPMMAQSDALSYLVTGKPLSQVKGGEGNMVGAAAQALGSAAGDLLAKGIGARLGIDAGVSSNEALGGGAAFTVGKYLSPRLYLSYGVGLFDPGTVITLRYLLSSRWNFEAEQATEFSRASFNYRYEK